MLDEQNADAKPIRWLLYGMYGTINVGDEAVAYSVMQGLDHCFGKGQYLINVDNITLFKNFLELDGVEYFEGRPFCPKFWLNFYRYPFIFSKVDAVVVGGGGLIHDTFTWRAAATAIMVAALGRLWNKPSYIIGVGVGPLKGKFAQKLLARLIPYVNWVTVRDQGSLELLDKMCGSNPTHQQTADVVCSLDILDFALTSARKDSSLICVAFREWPGLDEQSFAEFIDGLAEQGYRIQLQCYEIKYDPIFYKRILSYCQAKTREKTEIFIPKTLQEVLTSLSQAGCVYSMRLHGCILGTHVGAPLIPIAYEPKVRGFIKQLGMSEYIHSVCEVNGDLSQQTDNLAKEWSQNGAKILQNFQIVRDQARKNFTIINDNLKKDINSRLSFRERCYLLFWVTVILVTGFFDSAFHILHRICRMIFRKTAIGLF